MLVVPLIESYKTLFPGPKRASRKALYADIMARCGGSRKVEHRIIRKWGTREVAIPDDAREAMQDAVIEAWTGEFDKEGLKLAISVYPKEIS